MHNVLRGIQNEKCPVFLDIIIINAPLYIQNLTTLTHLRQGKSGLFHKVQNKLNLSSQKLSIAETSAQYCRKVKRAKFGIILIRFLRQKIKK